MSRRALAALLSAPLVFLTAVPAGPAYAGGADHVVTATNDVDGREEARSGVQVAPFGGDSLTSENLALATASCTGCRTLAAAFQAILVTGNPSVVTPHNAAVAVNAACSGCVTYAFAYQYVVSTGGPASLSAAGQAEVDRIRDEVAAVVASGGTPADIDAQLGALKARFKATIDSEIVRHGGTPDGVEVVQEETAPAA